MTVWNGTTMLKCDYHLCLSVYIITFITGFPANILAFYTFSRKVWKKPTPIDILLLNLTISDLLFLIFLPFKMQEVANQMIWSITYELCPLSGFVFYMTIYNSTFFLTAVSVERYLGVAFPIQHSLRRRPVYAVLASIFIWMFSVLHLSIVYIMPYYDPSEWHPFNGTSAMTNSPMLSLRSSYPYVWSYVWFSSAFLFLICSFCYINFIRILLRLPNIGRRRRLRAIGLALGTLLVFALCFGPYNVSHVVGFVIKQNPGWRNKALLLSTFNACLDPLIFYFTSAAVRNTLGTMARGIWTGARGICHWSSKRNVTETEKNGLPKPQEINAL